MVPTTGPPPKKKGGAGGVPPAQEAAMGSNEDTPLVRTVPPPPSTTATATGGAASSTYQHQQQGPPVAVPFDPELAVAFEEVTASRPRRMLVTSLLSLGLLLLAGLMLARVDRQQAPHAATGAQFRMGDAGPDEKLGVCYDPRHNAAYPHNPKQAFAEDFPRIAQHFKMVRTFYSVYYGAEVMPYIAKAGLRAALGVSIANGRAEEEKAAAIRAYKADPDSIAAIYVGNEDLIPAGPFSVDEIIGHIQDLRNAGVKAPIGTAQRINEWLSPSPELDKLAAACDVIGVNIYPYFTPPQNGGEAWQIDNMPIENMKGQFNAVMGRYHGQEWKVRMTETGWPTGGSRNFAGHDATVDLGARYFHDWVGWACGSAWDSYYYTAFDHREGTSPDYEQYFGVMTADGEPKFDLPGGVC